MGKALNIYSGTSFSVGRKEPNKLEFQHGKNMWDGLIWNNINNILNNVDITGDANSAKNIEQILNGLYQEISQYNSNKEAAEAIGITSYEVNLIKQIFASANANLEETVQTKGFSFENTISNLVTHLFVNREEIKTGTSQIGSISFKTTEKVDVGARKLRKIVLANAKKEVNQDIKQLVYRIEGGWEKGISKTALIRTAKRSGKIDIFVDGAKLGLRSELSPKMKDLANLLAHHTFSLKNYASSYVHLGDPDFWRALPAFYYGATRDTNFANLSRFLFVTKADENDKTIASYRDTAFAIYELTGIGLNTGLGTNGTRAVDYLMILNPGPVIKVKSTKAMIESFIRSKHNFSFSGRINVDNY